MFKVLQTHFFAVIVFLVSTVLILSSIFKNSGNKQLVSAADTAWVAPSLFVDRIEDEKERELVIYGEELIANTSKYLGPKGKVIAISNGMNCQNCHLDAGTRIWGNNYSAVFSTYPKFRERSGGIETIYKRVNDCFERSLNGKTLDSSSIEMKAIFAYMKWLGKDVKKGEKPNGAGLMKLPYLQRAADVEKGKLVYINKCQSCHGNNGEGVAALDSTYYATPPLWGKNSYNDGAGLYRLSNFAAFVKNNMPFNQASHTNPQLTNEEAWDVAAYVNSQPRPHKDQKNDWPNISKKPVDFPFGPYSDTFSERQHKYGPFKPIEIARLIKKLN